MSARILVVEDEEALTTLLRYNLDAEGYDVETVGRGDDADTRLKERVPDLIVLDWMLPGLSGIELCRRLRARPETRQLPIIMLTARGEESERVRGLATGADDYIVKPFSVPELLAREYPTRFGSPPAAIGPVTVSSATRSIHQNQNAKLPSSATTRNACNTISVPTCACRRLSALRITTVRPTADTTTHTTTSSGANHNATPSTCGNSSAIAFASV